MSTRDEKIIFWDDKIVSWDRARYERTWNPSNPITQRMSGALHLLKSHVSNKTILELGCGTGRTIPMLFELGIKNYVGLDFSEKAIAYAKEKIAGKPFEDKCVLYNQEAATPVVESPDVVFSLGLLDWLSDNDIKTVSSLYKHAPFLHSYSQKDRSLGQLIHKLYVQLLYGWRTNGYVPRYFNNEDLISLFYEQRNNKLKFVKTSGTSFSTFVHNLPNE